MAYNEIVEGSKRQKAARKLGMSVSRTMSVAQQLYKAGAI